MPFSFLNNLGQSLASYLSPAISTVKNAIDEFLPGQKSYIQGSAPTPRLNIPPSPTPQPQVPPPAAFSQGFSNYSPNLPIASLAPQFSQAASQLPPTVDPYLPAILALMETSGGRNLSAANNPFNISGIQGGQHQLINYPNMGTALLGGQNAGDISQGLVGLLESAPQYQNFRQSGNLADFFNTYSPPGAEYGNPSLDELLARYNLLRELFGR